MSYKYKNATTAQKQREESAQPRKRSKDHAASECAKAKL
jgi:hypothetical protein